MTRFSTDIRSNTDHDLFKGMTKKKKDKDRKQEAIDVLETVIEELKGGSDD